MAQGPSVGSNQIGLNPDEVNHSGAENTLSKDIETSIDESGDLGAEESADS